MHSNSNSGSTKKLIQTNSPSAALQHNPREYKTARVPPPPESQPMLPDLKADGTQERNGKWRHQSPEALPNLKAINQYDCPDIRQTDKNDSLKIDSNTIQQKNTSRDIVGEGPVSPGLLKFFS